MMLSVLLKWQNKVVLQECILKKDHHFMTTVVQSMDDVFVIYHSVLDHHNVHSLVN